MKQLLQQRQYSSLLYFLQAFLQHFLQILPHTFLQAYKVTKSPTTNQQHMQHLNNLHYPKFTIKTNQTNQIKSLSNTIEKLVNNITSLNLQKTSRISKKNSRTFY